MNNLVKWIKYEDEKILKNRIEKDLIESGFTVIKMCEHFFEVQGYTGIWLLSESHLAIHSFPEEDKIYIELSSCVDKPFFKMKQKLEEYQKNIKEF